MHIKAETVAIFSFLITLRTSGDVFWSFFFFFCKLSKMCEVRVPIGMEIRFCAERKVFLHQNIAQPWSADAELFFCPWTKPNQHACGHCFLLASGTRSGVVQSATIFCAAMQRAILIFQPCSFTLLKLALMSRSQGEGCVTPFTDCAGGEKT